MSAWTDALQEGAQQLGVALSAEQEARFARYLELLLERNAHVNLTAITDPVDVAIKHFVDSLTVETVWQAQEGDRVIDIGAGAGFPGLPLAIRHPEVEVVLNDSVRKKVDFLRDVIADLGLPHARAEWARAEELGRNPAYRAQFSVVVVRAVAHLAILIEYALPLLRVGGVLIAMKGPSGVEELAQSSPALEKIGGVIAEERALTLPGGAERRLIVIRKGRGTPKEYPRDPGQIKKRPLYLASGNG